MDAPWLKELIIFIVTIKKSFCTIYSSPSETKKTAQSRSIDLNFEQVKLLTQIATSCFWLFARIRCRCLIAFQQTQP